ncbi:hypothetical protein EJ08DRAFT_532321 [Tothia fuscella]|uniref:Uncharacterized protein n=1 Tax=Tothia fuscella TaxID=1048955 RepID=A0A9P4TT87_9PEZI|nr:hypothetical protein EJ08DRAFT_532321 [Tothia fuscella]
MFDPELIRAVCATKILESEAFKDIKLNEPLLATYMFTLAQSDDVSKYYAVKIIHQVVDYLLEQRPQDQGRRIEYIRSLCTLITTDCCYRSFNSIVQWIDEDTGEPLYRCRSYNFLENCLPAAVYLGLTSLVKKMLNDGVKNTSTYFNTALLRAVQRNDVELSHLLLEARDDEVWSEEIDQAAHDGNIDLLQLLLESDRINKSRKESNFLGAVQAAAAGGQVTTMEYLIWWGLVQYKVKDLDALYSWIHTALAKNMYSEVLIQAALHSQESTV